MVALSAAAATPVMVLEVGGIGIQVGDGLGNFGVGAIDGGQGRTIDGAVAIGGLSMAAISAAFCSNTCDGAVEVGGIGIEVGDGLNNSGGGAVDLSQSRTSDGAVAIGGLDGGDIGGVATPVMVLLKLVGSASRSVRA